MEEAIAHYRKALEIKPDYADARNNLANALANCGQIDEAITHYRKALEIKPDAVETHVNLANALASRGMPDEALEHYKKAFALATARKDKALADLVRARIEQLKPADPAAKQP